MFYQTFVFLAFHYVYRYVVLCKSVIVVLIKSKTSSFSPPWLAWFLQNQWRNWVILAVSSDLMYVGKLPWMIVADEIIISCSIIAAAYVGWHPTEKTRRVYAPIMMETYGIDLYADNRPGFLGIAFWVWFHAENLSSLPSKNIFSDSSRRRQQRMAVEGDVCHDVRCFSCLHCRYYHLPVSHTNTSRNAQLPVCRKELSQLKIVTYQGTHRLEY